MKFITIIPARGGSKRLPGKNTKILGNKPLIAHTIEYSLRNTHVIETYVSTDADDIKSISAMYGATVIDRPKEIATDLTPSSEVLKHAVEYLMEQNIDFDYVILLQATNPLRPNDLLDEAISIIEHENVDSLFTVSRCDKKLGRIIDGIFTPWNYTFGMRSQDMEPLYYENGLLYITSKDLLLNGIIEGASAYPLIVNHPFGEVDIDTVDDFEYANYIMKLYGRE